MSDDESDDFEPSEDSDSDFETGKPRKKAAKKATPAKKSTSKKGTPASKKEAPATKSPKTASTPGKAKPKSSKPKAAASAKPKKGERSDAIVLNSDDDGGDDEGEEVEAAGNRRSRLDDDDSDTPIVMAKTPVAAKQKSRKHKASDDEEEVGSGVDEEDGQAEAEEDGQAEAGSDVDNPNEAGDGQEKSAKKRAPIKAKQLESSLPLIVSTKKRPASFLMQVGPEVDLTGDVGIIGRANLTKDKKIMLDLKGNMYQGSLVKTNTFLIVESTPRGEKTPAQARITQTVDSFLCASIIDSTLDGETLLEGELEDDENVTFMHSEDIVNKSEEATKKTAKSAKSAKRSKKPSSSKPTPKRQSSSSKS